MNKTWLDEKWPPSLDLQRGRLTCNYFKQQEKDCNCNKNYQRPDLRQSLFFAGMYLNAAEHSELVSSGVEQYTRKT